MFNLLKKLQTFIFIFCFSFYNYAFSYEKNKFDLIIDTDAAIDDWLAVLYSLNQEKKSNLLGITIAATGEAHCKPAQINIANLIYLAGKEKKQIPISCGDSVPLEGFHTFPDKWRIDSDTMNNIIIQKNPNPNILAQHAVEWLHETLNKNSNPVVILSIGPLTNIGQLIKKYPEVTKKVKRIYIMGGAIYVKGNLIIPNITESLKNKYAEWNIWVDPLAAKIVMNSDIPLSLVTLDATNQVQVTRDFMKTLKKNMKSKAANFYADILDKNLEFVDSGEYYFWDILTAASMYFPFCTEKKTSLDVITQYESNTNGYDQIKSFGKEFNLALEQFKDNMQNRQAFEQLESGRTLVLKTRENKKLQKFCTKVSEKQFKKSLIETLNYSN
ncbi:nucleoside hydrolase [Silvanigrella aquatica]|uniref:Inosine/uridine-preferring nucleoside hydrolase domain-containing protein n=1 Tax=Silvanigrella aquatica TaxID=1915309 RepID=A0A1L4CZP0_9BACT|nr:nucleoside hydrolase [Silvanigrella aquatica]APJ03422.1 hypothetical protein AXG55_05685 [Silvanigrella aquatica]